MHPLLGHPRRLAWYFAAWVPLGALLAYLLSAGGALRLGAAGALAAPLALAYACVCLSLWYTCRTMSLQADPGRAIAAHITAAVVAAALWVAFARLLAAGLAALDPARPWSGPASLVPLWITGVFLYLLAVAAYYLLIGVEAARRAELLARDAELRALKAQINPHFLFNSLNSISALTASDPGRAREMCVLLGDFLRRTLGLAELPAVPLSDELVLIQAFLAVEQVRFGARLQLDQQIAPEALAFLVPPLLLQPLVENAVVHGVAHLVEGGCIELRAVCGPDALRLSVENPFDADAPRRGHGGVGLANVRDRLLAGYGPAARMESAAGAGRFRVTLILPLETK